MKIKNYNFYLIIALIIILADRLTKSWALHLTSEKNINQFLSFSLTFNRGINWGFFNSTNLSVFIFINSAIALVIIALAYYTFFCWKLKQPIFGHILILAGAVSNYYDRMFYGGVIDFIVLSWGNWSWPTFNIADSAICIGIGLFIFSMFRVSHVRF